MDDRARHMTPRGISCHHHEYAARHRQTGRRLATGSVSILSEAAHSGVDSFVAVLAWAAIRYAQRPADRTHPYGHGKVETLTSFGEGILILAGRRLDRLERDRAR